MRSILNLVKKWEKMENDLGLHFQVYCRIPLDVPCEKRTEEQPGECALLFSLLFVKPYFVAAQIPENSYRERLSRHRRHLNDILARQSSSGKLHCSSNKKKGDRKLKNPKLESPSSFSAVTFKILRRQLVLELKQFLEDCWQKK